MRELVVLVAAKEVGLFDGRKGGSARREEEAEGRRERTLLSTVGRLEDQYHARRR